jgi:hypothetical protein
MVAVAMRSPIRPMPRGASPNEDRRLAVVTQILLCPVVGRSEESQRDSAAKPRVARHELPWETDATPSGLYVFSVVGTSRCDVPARAVAGGTNTDGVFGGVKIAPLNAARTAQRAVPSALGSEHMQEGESPALAELNASN